QPRPGLRSGLRQGRHPFGAGPARPWRRRGLPAASAVGQPAAFHRLLRAGDGATGPPVERLPVRGEEGVGGEVRRDQGVAGGHQGKGPLRSGGGPFVLRRGGAAGVRADFFEEIGPEPSKAPMRSFRKLRLPDQPTSSRLEKKKAISRAAEASLSDPWTEFSPFDSANSLRMVPGAA